MITQFKKLAEGLIINIVIYMNIIYKDVISHSQAPLSQYHSNNRLFRLFQRVAIQNDAVFVILSIAKGDAKNLDSLDPCLTDRQASSLSLLRMTRRYSELKQAPGDCLGLNEVNVQCRRGII